MTIDWLFKFGHSIMRLCIIDSCCSCEIMIILGENVIERTLIRKEI